MGEEVIINRVNMMLADKGYSHKIKDLPDLRAFLSNSKNKSLGIYDDIQELYDLLIVGPGMW